MKIYKEFAAQNRPSGWNTWLTLDPDGNARKLLDLAAKTAYKMGLAVSYEPQTHCRVAVWSEKAFVARSMRCGYR